MQCQHGVCVEPKYALGSSQGHQKYFCPPGYLRMMRAEECTSEVARVFSKKLSVKQNVPGYPRGCYSGPGYWAVHFNSGASEGVRAGLFPLCRRSSDPESDGRSAGSSNASNVSCQDTDRGASGLRKDVSISMTCSQYEDSPNRCQYAAQYYDDADFTATSMCCACAGGVSSDQCSSGVGMPCPSGYMESGSTFGCCECAQGTYAHQGKCLSSCPDGLFADATDNVCKHGEIVEAAGSDGVATVVVRNQDGSVKEISVKVGAEEPAEGAATMNFCGLAILVMSVVIV